MGKKKNDYVLIGLHTESTKFGGIRGVGINDHEKTIIGKFRDMGQV